MTGGGSRATYLLVTACYWLFTLSDGALRMLVLLHLHDQGRTPLALALVLLPYEIAGVFTNLLGGWLGARCGLKATLLVGLLLQASACAMLAADPAWLTLAYVMATQVLSGTAKDLAKTAAKSYVRKLAPDDHDAGLFQLVAILTGSKNAMKGLGFFAGGALLAWVGFQGTNLGLAVLLLLAAMSALALLPKMPGKPTTTWTAMLTHGAAIRWLALARCCLFGSRDVWFAVALPVFLVTTLAWSPALAGTFLAAWVIGYGCVQAASPALLQPRSLRRGATLAVATTAALLLPLLGTVLALHFGAPVATTVLVGLCLYGVVFALASSLHSWLVVGLAGAEDVVERVGFYYAANSVGRLLGTLASGWLFGAYGQGVAGLTACLLAAAVTVLFAVASSLPIRRAR